MHWATRTLRWGENRGGFIVLLRGRDAAGKTIDRSWHLVAEGRDGPMIPAMPAEAVVRRVLAGTAPTPGARPAVSDLTLEDLEPLFARHAIAGGERDPPDPGQRLYPSLLGAAWARLPAAIRAMHEGEGGIAEGLATVERGRNPLSRLAARIAGFPPAATNIPVTVRFDLKDGVETWTRRFGEHSFFSLQYAGTGRWDRLLVERFGPMTFAMALVREDGKLRLVLRHWRVFGVPLPLWLAPRSQAWEEVENGRFRFHVEISHPLTGLIVRYRGHLTRR